MVQAQHSAVAKCTVFGVSAAQVTLNLQVPQPSVPSVIKCVWGRSTFTSFGSENEIMLVKALNDT